MPTHHSRKPSSGQHHASQLDAQTSPARKHQRNSTAPDTPSLLRLPSNSSHGAPSSPRSRRATNPTTPTLTPGQVSTSSATSPSYFSPQPAASGKEARSPATRKPPAFFSGHGVDASRGPPNSLITRGNVDIARRSQNPSDFAFAQQQLLQQGLVSPGSTPHRRRRGSGSSADLTPQTQTPNLSRQNSTATSRRDRHMESSVDGSSEYGSGLRSQSEDTQAMNYARGGDTSGTDGEQGEDLFIAAANSKENGADAPSRGDRLRSRIAIRNNRPSFPLGSQPASHASHTSKLPSAIDTGSAVQYRRASQLSSTPRNQREQTPSSPANPLDTPRSRLLDLSPKPSPSARSKDSDLSPHQFLSQFSRRRPSYPDAAQTPPNRTQTYRPSNLHYSSSRDNPETPQNEISQENTSRPDGTESLDSTGPAASVWDELDDLKSRIRRIELGGKMPTTSGAVVANASADRPRTANTSVTTVSSSPRQQRKTNESPSESTEGAETPQKVHPLLKDALAKAKRNIAPSIYRALEATASEAMALAELAGSAGPQGTLQSASSILNNALVPDRQVRRKADNICRSLTELCIELCDPKSSIASPALRAGVVSNSRRPSVQINGDSPQIRASIEPESDTLPRSSPSRAMSRIEARRTSLIAGKLNGNTRESSQEPPTPSQSTIPNRFSRAGTSLHRTRRTAEDEDEDPTLRAPSRAMTDFRDIRSTNNTKRFSREYTSREPMPELQPSPSIQNPTSLRRPTVPSIENNHLLQRDGSRRYNLDRQNSPAYEKHLSADFPSRLAQPTTQYASNRASLGSTGLGRSGSLSRRLRGASAGE